MLLERQLSSTGCSTSYSTCLELPLACRSSCQRRMLRSRCAAQPRQHRGSHSCERESSRRHAPPHRFWGSVAASAAAVAPPSPPRDGFRSLPPDLVTSIPDAIPSLEDLEDLRSRAMQASGPRPVHFNSTPSRPNDAPLNSNSRRTAPLSEPILPLDSAPVQPPQAVRSAEHQLIQPPSSGTDPSAKGVHPQQQQPVGRSALSQAVPLPQQVVRPVPLRDGARSQHHNSFNRRRGQGENPVTQLTLIIKGVRDWHQLPGLLAELGPGGLDPFNAAVFLTHLAQRVAAASPLSQADVPIIERMQATALAVVEQNMHEYRARQISNLTWALARLGLPSGAAFLREHLLPAAYPLLPWYEPQHLSNTLWALATAGVAPDDGWLEEYLTAAFVALQRRAYAPQHLANVLWALERLGVMPDEEWMAAYYDCADAASPAANAQDCSNILSSLALMAMHQQRPEATAALAARLAVRLEDLLAVDNATAATSGRRGATFAAGIATPELLRLSTASMTPTPVSAAQAAEPKTTGRVVAAGAAAGHGVSDQSVANSLWALAVMGCQPSEGLWEVMAAALRLRLADPTRAAPGVEPGALTIVLWAATTLGRALPPAVMGLLYSRVRSAAMEAMEPRSLATMVWALSTAAPGQARPPSDWVNDVVAGSLRSVPQLNSQAVSNMLYGLCILGARPAPVWMSAVINHFHRDLASQASGQSVSNVLWCLAKMGYRLNPEGMEILVGLVHSRLSAWQHQRQHLLLQLQDQRSRQPRLTAAAVESRTQLRPSPPFSCQEMSNVLYALSSMGYLPDPEGPLAQLALEAAKETLHEAGPQELSNYMWSLASLQVRPSNAWLADFCAAAEARLPAFRPRDLAQTLYGVAKLRLPMHTPPPPAPPMAASPSVPLPNNATTAAAAVHDLDLNGTLHNTIITTTTTTDTVVASWMGAALAAAPRLMADASAQDLCNVSWALVQLRVPVAPDSPLAVAFANRLVAVAGRCEASLLALGVWALGKWRVRPTRVQMEQLEVATFRQLPYMRPHELAAMLSGFAGMGHTPPVAWLEEALQSIVARSRQFGPQDWTMVLYSLARVQDESMRPGVEELVQRLLPRLHRLPVPSLVLLAYSCGCMGPGHTSRTLVGRCLALLAGVTGKARLTPASAPTTMELSSKELADSVAASGTRGTGRRNTRQSSGRSAALGSAQALGPVGGARSPGWARSKEGEAGEVDAEMRPMAVSSLTAVELSALLWSAVRVGLRALPQDFREQFLSHTRPLLPELAPSLVAAYLWAAGRLRMWLPADWRRLLVERAEAVLEDMRGRELAMCMAGLMWLRIWPSRTLLLKLAACFSARRSEMHERLGAHAATALDVLRKRYHASLVRERRFGPRRAWLVHVRRGNERAVASGKGTTSRMAALVAVPEGFVSRREALRKGVLRRRGSSLPAVLVQPAAEGKAPKR